MSNSEQFYDSVRCRMEGKKATYLWLGMYGLLYAEAEFISDFFSSQGKDKLE